MTNQTKKRFRPSLAQYRHELSQTMHYHDLLYATRLQLVTQEAITKDLLERLTIERKNHRQTWRIVWDFLGGLVALQCGIYIIQSIYGA